MSWDADPRDSIEVWERERESRPLPYDAHGTPLVSKKDMKRRIGFEEDHAISI